ncbi:hypothetical protein ILYODFUR_020093 [Ilyodon furcidens]|uniref:Prolactin receptor n=1 Tax=Ilyodon furcidens TaxID=33524 RepID=A0ABV0SYM0_9TELE
MAVGPNTGMKSRNPTSRQHFSAHSGGVQAIPRPEGIHSPSVKSGSPLEYPHSGTYSVNIERETPKRHSDHMPEPPQLLPFDAEKQWLNSELPADGAPPFISKAEPDHPNQETKFSLLYLGIKTSASMYSRKKLPMTY